MISIARRIAPVPALAIAALAGAATMLGAIWVASDLGEIPLPGYIASICRSILGDSSGKEAGFIGEGQAAMTIMMRRMDIAPLGDVDRDFVEMMIPHHQGAIEMAQAMLRYGHNERLRRLAQEIIVTQQQEIAAMRFAVGELLPPSGPVPNQFSNRSR